MRVATKLAIVLIAIALCAKLSAKQTAVTIDLTEQMAYLLEDGRVTCVSPIASGKEGCGTPVGSFRVIGKDLNHQSGSFGLISNADGGIVNPNATPGSYVPPGCHYVPAPMPYFMEFRKYVGMHAGDLPGIARLCSDAQRPCCEILCQSADRHIGKSDRERQECKTCQESDSDPSARQFQVRRSRMSSNSFRELIRTHSNG
jgi:hypothetical protein